MYFLAVFLPLFGAIAVGFFGTLMGKRPSQIMTTACVGLSAIFSCFIFNSVALQGKHLIIPLFTWIHTEAIQISCALQFDTLSTTMLAVVTIVSTLVHVYSIGYMDKDNSVPRFMAYLNLFTFFMLILVMSENLIQLFVGWEGVGLCSYFLIGFWYGKPEANDAALKAFIVNRVGDFGFVLGLAAVYLVFGTFTFSEIFFMLPGEVSHHMNFMGIEGHSITIMCLLLFFGCMGKSAQIGLHTWLPDAMEGPTPVSALIHAATMVTAGVFLVVRMAPLFEQSPLALMVITVVGATTAIFAGTVAITQNDIKRVIAYSTCSQLGYMFFAIGLSAYSAAIFHLVTHAFFKALLFLGAGSVIHALSHEQDMRKMGGIASFIPLTTTVMWIGSLALAGIPFFAGYYSKETILEVALGTDTFSGSYAYLLGMGGVFLTALYSWRLLFLTFNGKPRADEKVMAHIHEAPLLLTIPLVILALGSIFSGYLGYAFFIEDTGGWAGSFVPGMPKALEIAHTEPFWVTNLPLVLALLGIGLAWFMYILFPKLPPQVAKNMKGTYWFLYHKWYFDELYQLIFVRPTRFLGSFLYKWGDLLLIDRWGPDGVAKVVQKAAGGVGRIQTGYLYHYAFAMILGIGLFILYLVRGS
ncbi:MAG: NADH-quinone oxidoreductase subunit L [Alphaproteobacteria bacterium]|nr:NADH-quinone oxidoreductase subunit L [Alphaproteobacteria bacterium]MBT5390510.1 NADH-quinone oxidoreductase subunit L [Alphaproteobacteria bacterium]MBT5654928.1 NADH-quinone oxidoreductase subunit L [Alphaproteobacteria bacterium]